MTTPTNKNSSNPSMILGIILLVILTIMMLAGVLPARGSGQDIIFRTPIFVMLLAILCTFNIYCSIKKILQFFSKIGFILSHIGIVIILVGSFISFLFEQKTNIELHYGENSLAHHIKLENGKIIDLGFKLNLKSFKIEYHDPIFALYKNNKIINKFKIAKNNILDLKEAGQFQVTEIIKNASMTNYKLKGKKELIIYAENEEIFKKIDLDQNLNEIILQDGKKLLISKKYNNLPTMKMGMQYKETSFPSKPGLILRLLADKNMYIISLEAGEKPVLLGSHHPMHFTMPNLVYSFPKIENFKIGDDPASNSPFCKLKGLNNTEHKLFEGSKYTDTIFINDSFSLKILRPAEKQYFAEIEISPISEKPFSRIISINNPLIHKKWKIYLNSYLHNNEGVLLTLRKDPGNIIVVLGIFLTLIGIFNIFYLRKRIN